MAEFRRPPTGPGPRVWAVVMAMTIGLVLAATASSPATATNGTATDPDNNTDADVDADSQFVTLQLEPLSSIPWRDRVRVPTRVVLEAERSVSGTLVVVDDPDGGTEVTWEFDVDVAAGSRVEFPLELTTGWNGVVAAATVRSGGDVVASARLNQGGDGQEATGYVAVYGIDDAPRRVPERGTEQQLATVRIGSDLRGLVGASTLIATPVALEELTPGTAGALAIDSWVQGGGQLVVDGPTASLDARYHQLVTANPDRFAYGAGSIYYDPDWRLGVPLGGYVGGEGLARLAESQGLGSGSGGELALLAGLALPSAGLVAGVLLVYALVAGPLLFFGLGARNRERQIWKVLPALALVVSAGVLTVGLVDRRNRSDAHITIVEVNPEGSRATTNLLVGSGLSGDRQVETPEGWAYLGQSRSSGQRPVRLRVGRTTTEIGVDMPSGSTAVIRMAGAAPAYDGLLSIDDIRAGDDGQIRAAVTNNSDGPLVEAVAFVGNARTELGELAPGATVEVSVDTDDGSTRTMRELLLWPRVQPRWNGQGEVAVPLDREAETAAGAWTEWRIEQGTSASPENMLGVVAWSDDLTDPVNGGIEGRTALFARVAIPSDTAPTTSFASVARLPTYDGEPFLQGNFFGYEEDLRVTLGPDAATDDLAVQVDANGVALGFRVGDRWRWADLSGLPNEATTVAVPSEAVVDGEVLIRALQPEWAWGTGATVRLTVDPDAAQVGLVDEPRFRPGVDGQFGPPPGFGEVVEEVNPTDLVAGDRFVHDTFLPPGGVLLMTLVVQDPGVLTLTTGAPAGTFVIEVDGPFGGQGTDDNILSFPIEETGPFTVIVSEVQGIGAEIQLAAELGAEDE